VKELNNERIDVIEWNDDIKTLITNSLSPAKISRIEINAEEKSAKVIVPEAQLSLAIGKEGQNVRLAAKLTGWKIDIVSEEGMKKAEETKKEEKKEELAPSEVAGLEVKEEKIEQEG
jgi:N utilization substance protein A